MLKLNNKKQYNEVCDDKIYVTKPEGEEYKPNPLFNSDTYVVDFQN